MSSQKQLREHRERFGGDEAMAFSAPARVNIIGEHTDYTGGFVLPMTIGFETVAVVSPRSDGRAVLWSANFGDTVEYELATLKVEPRSHWSDYPMGVAWSLREAGVTTPGFSLSLSGDVPVGAGLSSSASVEVATAMALLAVAHRTLPGEQIATLSRRAENEYVGASSGIMDQFVITNGVAQRALLLDCRSLAYDLLPLPESIRVVVVNSMVQHSVATGEYGDRRGEVEHGQAVLREQNSSIQLLRDATLADLEKARDAMGDVSFRRCRHIVTDNGRVMEMKAALAAEDLKRCGDLMYDAHRSVRDDFEASCEEVDTLVELAAKIDGCLGARITGGGFGGCTVNLVERDKAESFVETIRQHYKSAVGIDADAYICEAVDGAVARLGRSA